VEQRQARAQWTATLKTYASPVMGHLLARDIGLPHVLDVLRPIWTTKTETATRVRARLEAVLDWATTHGYREGLNPARWKGHLDNLLPKSLKSREGRAPRRASRRRRRRFHGRAPEARGHGRAGAGIRILTAARSGEVRGATWAEIDKAAAVWTIPASA